MKLTELEQKFLEVFKNNSQEVGTGEENIFEDVTSYVLDYESEELNMKKSQVKGIIGDLVKKNVLVMDEINGENALIYYEKEE